jgi:hypothetical protein
MRYRPLTRSVAVSPFRPLDSLDNRHFLAMFLGLANGRVAERLKAPDSKSGVRETVPWVQIPPLPPVYEMLAGPGWGWHIETAVHVIRLILGGVFDYPNV